MGSRRRRRGARRPSRSRRQAPPDRAALASPPGAGRRLRRRAGGSPALVTQPLPRLTGARPGETSAVLWSFAYFFCILSSYYVLRPVRDEMGVASGVARLPWLFTGTFLVMLAVMPIFGALAARYPRRTLLPALYVFFIGCILALWALLRHAAFATWAPATFFIWLSVFNLFVVSVFWSFMADVWSEAQARRVFGFIAAGGSAGALVGPALTGALARVLRPADLLGVAAVLLSGALVCLARLRRWTLRDTVPAREATRKNDAALGGHALGGLTGVARSPFLLAICGFTLVGTVLATFVYFQQAQIMGAAIRDSRQRTSVFAMMDLAVNALTIGTQLFLTGRLLTRLGLARMLALLPALSALGFAALAVVPRLAVLVGFQVVRRAAQYGMAGPAREVLFTVVSREEKYKAKNFIDTAVSRGGDALSGWAFATLLGLGLGVTGIALVAIPLSAAWIAIAVYLARREAVLREGGHDGAT